MSRSGIRERYRNSQARYYYLDEILIFQESVLSALRNSIERHHKRGASIDNIRRYMQLAEEFELASSGMPSTTNISALEAWVEQCYSELRQARNNLEIQHGAVFEEYEQEPEPGLIKILAEAAIETIFRRHQPTRQELAGDIYYRYRNLHRRMIDACESGLISGIACTHAREF